MALHSTILYGPLNTRRLGSSLGINLLPAKRKICNFECVYCECGWTNDTIKDKLPTHEELTYEFKNKFIELAGAGRPVDHITFAGNGEPTMHPQFEQIIDTMIDLRNEFYPQARIAVLSNATRVSHPPVFRALQRIEDRILKLDAGTEKMFQQIDIPDNGMTLDRVTADIKKFGGNVTIQTLFLRGFFKNQVIDNTSEEELAAWIERLRYIQPVKVMIYSIERETPVDRLTKVTKNELEDIVEKLRQNGISAESYA
ncbi:radical SAM protein [bacterium]|nr:radical SAM protein [bacterium]